jgi:hypothetical protein
MMLLVKTKVSCLVLIAVIILEPDCRLINPAVLPVPGCQSSGSGPISGSTLDQRISNGS